jgi:uncharacterized protein (TIGR02391 family)
MRYHPPVPVDAIRRLALPDLAFEALRELVQATGSLHRNNWLRGAQMGLQDEPDAKELLRSLAEAWDWLTAKALISRDPEQGGEWSFVTRRGRELAAMEDGRSRLLAEERLDVDLHPLLERRVRRLFLQADYELAAFEAMKQIEVRVRGLAGAPPSVVGVKLMRDAFGEKGRLRDPSMEGGEQIATMELFAGAMGVFKNPTSHRPVEFDDPTRAAEVVLFADLLMRVLDDVEARVTA